MPRALLSLSDFKEKRERAARDGSHAVHVGGELPAELRELPEVAKRVASTPGLDLEIVWAKFSRWASSRAPWRPEDFAAAWVRWVMNERVSVAPRASPATDELRRPYHAEFEDDGELERMTQEQIIANREHAKRALEALG